MGVTDSIMIKAIRTAKRRLIDLLILEPPLLELCALAHFFSSIYGPDHSSGACAAGTLTRATSLHAAHWVLSVTVKE
jgi:hypothetical protein